MGLTCMMTVSPDRCNTEQKRGEGGGNSNGNVGREYMQPYEGIQAYKPLISSQPSPPLLQELAAATQHSLSRP